VFDGKLSANKYIPRGMQLLAPMRKAAGTLSGTGLTIVKICIGTYQTRTIFNLPTRNILLTNGLQMLRSSWQG